VTGKVHIDRAARLIRAGGIVAYPTEAVFGLGCLPDNRDAVLRLLAIKQRRVEKGLVLIAASFEDLAALVELPETPMRNQILATWPGPVTWVLPARRTAPWWITGRRDTLAVRVTAHALARALCARVAGPLVSTSANVSRRPPHKRLLQLRRDLGAFVDFVLPGPLGDSARPTAIRDGRTGRTLRAG
jgi:L-threonylcarbamoyladenylate synthase